MFDIDKKIEEWNKINMEETGQILYAMNRDTLTLLFEGSRLGLSNVMLCSYADISQQTLYTWFNKFPEIKEEIERLKESPKIRAINNIIAKVNEGDLETAKWYAERKIKEEFAQRQEVTGADGEKLIPTQEDTEKKIQELTNKKLEDESVK